MGSVVLVSKHKKGAIIAPFLAKLGLRLQEYTDFDTDILGTFSGEIERTLSPKECALAKAKKACELANSDIGLGSEGSFGGGPMAGFVNWNQEIICYYQKPSNTVIYAIAEGPCKIGNLKASSIEELLGKLSKHPGQHWIYRHGAEAIKGLTQSQLIAGFESGEFNLTVELEPDLRAMHCPERRAMIAKATEDLMRRLTNACPSCQRVDFVEKDVERGLPCQWCHAPTNLVKATIRKCEHCGYTETTKTANEFADPSQCQYCNP